MKYVLRRHEDGKYVAPAGQQSSYTTKLENARIFNSQEAAQAEACGNESPIPVDELLREVDHYGT